MIPQIAATIQSLADKMNLAKHLVHNIGLSKKQAM
jgi:hypothetical protein